MRGLRRGRHTGLASWGSPEPVSSSCRSIGTSEPAPSGIHRGGGFIQTYCTYEVGGRKAATAAELALALSPIDSPSKALGLVAALHPLAFDEDLATARTEKQVKLPVSTSASLPVFDVSSFPGGFIVRAPLYRSCPLSVHRVSFRVTTSGEVCFAQEQPVLIDAGTGVCAGLGFASR